MGGILRVLTRSKIIEFIQEGKQLSPKVGTAVLDDFEKNQPYLYNAIFGELSDSIAKESLDMADLFLDLSFDIIFVYKKASGDKIAESRDESWFANKVALLDAELKSLDNGSAMNGKFRERLSNRFVERCVEAGVQLEFLSYLDEQVQHYASFKSSRKKAIHVTNNLLFVVIRLMDDIYRDSNPV